MKVVLYTIGSILLLIVIGLSSFPDALFGPCGGDGFFCGSLRFSMLFYTFVIATIGLILVSLAVVQKTPETLNNNEVLLYRTMNPFVLLAIGAGAILIVYYDIGFNYFGAKTLIYAGAGLIFTTGFIGLVVRLFKR